MQIKIRFLFLLCVALNVVCSTVKAEMPEPELVFNCQLANDKYAIIRLENNIPIYLYGSIEHVEMTLPKKNASTDTIRKARIPFSGGGAMYYRYINGVYNYIVYSGTGKGWGFTGLKVYKGNKLIMKKDCTQGGFLNNGYDGDNLKEDGSDEMNVYGGEN